MNEDDGVLYDSTKCITIDRLIRVLSEAKSRLGGNTRVIMEDFDMQELWNVTGASIVYTAKIDGEVERFYDSEGLPRNAKPALCLSASEE